MKTPPFDRSKYVYKNDASTELVKDAVRFFNGTPVHGLPPAERFTGTGVYALYYTGSEFDWPAKTIKAGGHGVPGGENMIKFEDDSIRYLTVYEAKLLQTSPKEFVITGAWGEAMRQIGNAVPVLLGEIISGHLHSLISEEAHELPSKQILRQDVLVEIDNKMVV